MTIIRKFLPIVVIAAGLVVAYLFYATAPAPTRKAPPKIVPQVAVMNIEKGSIPIIIKSIGTIIPSQEVDISSKLNGTIETLSENFQPGAFVKKDEVILQLDKVDYELELKKAEAQYASAKADYELEQGQQRVAKTEYNKLKEIIPGIEANTQTDLALREPYLAKAKANLAIAKANLDNAKIDLENTTIKAPFDALITSRNVSTGQHITSNQALANLIAIDEYWIDVTLAVETLYNNNILSHNATNLPVEVTTKAFETWDAKLLQTVNVLESGSRMGKLLVKVDDPLSLEENEGKTPLLMGDQVQINLNVGSFDNVVAVPRSAVKNNEYIWIVTDNKLKKQNVKVLWKDDELSYIDSTNLPVKSTILTSDITNLVEGMEVRSILFDINGNQIKSENQNQGKPQVQPADNNQAN